VKSAGLDHVLFRLVKEDY